MRLPEPPGPDPFYSLQGKRVQISIDGRQIRGRLISCRDSFVTVDPDKGPRVSFNKYAVTSIAEETRPVSRAPRIARQFWK